MDQTSIDYYENFAKTFVSENSRSKLAEDLAIKDQWLQAKKSFDIAVNWVYKGIKENDKPTAEYLSTRYVICKREMALAGYRLADNLKEIFHSSYALPAYVDMRVLEGEELAKQ